MKFLKIFEEYKSGSRTKALTIEQAVELYEKNCSDWNLDIDTQIYRGSFTAHPIFYGHAGSDEHELRYSANASNIYTSLFNHIPSWKKAPRRDKSFIMAMDPSIAENYGDNYDNKGYHIMIPYNGTKIGVCPSSDIWGTELHIIDRNFSIESIDGELNDFFRSNIKDPDLVKSVKRNRPRYDGVTHDNVLVKPVRESILDLCAAIDKIPKEELTRYYSYTMGDRKYPLQSVNKWLESYSDLKFFDYLTKVLDFDDNDFDIVNSQYELIPYNDREVWSDGEFIGIRAEDFEKFKSLIS